MIRQLVRMSLLVLVVVGGSTACDWFDDPSPDAIRVLIEGEPGEMLQLITSVEFFAARNEAGQMQVQVFASDTSTVTLPYDRTWSIKDEQRFLLLGTPSDGETTVVRLRVELDDEQTFDSDVQAQLETPMRFIYLFNQQVLQDFELL